MTSISLNRSQKSLHPFITDRSYDNNAYSSSYAKWMLSHVFAEANIYSENISQKNIHVTYSQNGAELPKVFVSIIGVPSIKCHWPKSNWVKNILQLCNTQNEDAALKEIALHTSRLKVNNEFSKLSTDLLSFEINKLPDIVLIALLRNTFSVRSHISCWDSLRDQIEQILEKRNRNPRLLLRGLKNYS
ncbi:MAG: hypothetical protein HOP34_04880 [Methylococcaceae bacterium]|nr:hypothetical protein [Methylococcaceae bacterium]